MYLMIDNFDSFVYNLKAYFEEMGRCVTVKMCVDVVNMYKGKIPILGVCLGHQILGYCAGAIVEKGKMPMHGKVTEIHTCGTGLFARLPESFHVTRYHSLVINGSSLPDDYRVDAISEDGAVMALSHKTYPVYGIQFHPEAVLTKYGHELLNNFITICKKWRAHDWQPDFEN